MTVVRGKVKFKASMEMVWLAGYSPHIPRRGAPQAPHGPGSTDERDREGPATAKTDSSFSIRALPHSLQRACTAAELTICSNFVPQARHLYSKMGMIRSPQTELYLKLHGVSNTASKRTGHL